MKQKTLIDLAHEKTLARNAKNKRMFQDGVNQRANIKQREITKVITQIAPCCVNTVELDLCHKKLQFENLPNIQQLDISYFTKNTLFARIFELIVDMRIPCGVKQAPNENIQLNIRQTGGIRTKQASFVPLTEYGSAKHLAARLNHIPLIWDRILHLEALDMKINYDIATKEWAISLATGKGSVVWMLFPPVVQLVPFSPTDAVKLIELYQLIASEVRCFY